MQTTKKVQEMALEQERLEDELATLAAHLNAATARFVELTAASRQQGVAAGDDFARWLAFRCGISGREAREYVRVAEALAELPLIRGAFARGELTFTKVRALTRVASPTSERSLLDLAFALTACQLERALRAFRRMSSEETRESHELEYVDHYWAEDGSLFLRARLSAEDGMLLVRALDAARERVRERNAAKRSREQTAMPFEPPRSPQVEALIELAQTALARPEPELESERAQLVVHVDAAALTRDGAGRSELEHGPVISPETARRLGCDGETVTVVEQDGLPLSVGRRRRTVPPKLRRLLDVRDDGCCRWPGCERRRHLAAHHRTHWANGGETSLDNLVLLCWHHHRLVHEGGYVVEDGDGGELRFRNRHGLICGSVSRSPPGSADELVELNRMARLELGPRTNRNGYGDRLDLQLAVAAVDRAAGSAPLGDDPD
jgi:hypothetical protein